MLCTASGQNCWILCIPDIFFLTMNQIHINCLFLGINNSYCGRKWPTLESKDPIFVLSSAQFGFMN